ncbi:MAG: sodium ABC transporter [Anaerolineales bacterium]|nr:ATP-binding cassette domain-containing protein [Anaerolineae bacterium]PWB55747.1 MAG: sodium ABC transporter [Anaerolineales bacterium]
MPAVELSHISKSFGTLKAVDDVSFDVEKGEIFGLLGPNGAGKTTAIRVLLDIFKPDSGEVSILGGPMTESKKDHIGYMPEERGLYQDIPLDRCLVYLGTLKGLSPIEAQNRISSYLVRFDLESSHRKKVKELSKGMQQKAQLISTLIHQPELLIIDEPFSGLDPINTQMVKDLLREQRDKGVTILMSTHQMHQVEELCDRIVLIDHGRTVLYGRLDDIRNQFAGHAVIVSTPNELPKLDGVIKKEEHNSSAFRLTLAPTVSAQQILHQLVESGIEVNQFEIAAPTLDEIFIRVVQQNDPEKSYE